MNTSTYSRKDTNVLKGIGVLLLMMHHCLNKKYPFTLVLLKEPHAYLPYITDMAKVCVFIFLFTSGLGMFRSFEKKLSAEGKPVKSTLRFELSHFIKFYQMFWFIYLIFVPLGTAFGRDPGAIYRHKTAYFLYDFFGISYIAKKVLFIPTWWYNSILLMCYLLMPLFFLFLRKLPKVVNAIVLGITIAVSLTLPYVREQSYVIYFVPFFLGMIAARYNIMESMRKALSRNTVQKILKLLILLVLLTAFICVRLTLMKKAKYNYELDWIPAVLIALLADGYLPKETVVSRFLQTLGSHSGNIYLFHGFIYSLYFSKFFYSFEYAPLVYIFGIFLFLGVSKLFDVIKDAIGYNAAFKRLIDKVNGVSSEKKAA